MTRALILALLVLGGTASAEPREDELIAVITIQPRAPYAGIYANLLIDRLDTKDRLDELGVWVDRLLKMPQILRGREGLTRRLQGIQIQFLSRRALLAYRRGKTTLSVEAWRDAARLFHAIAGLQRQRGEPTANALFNAGVALAAAGENYAALVAWDAVENDRDLEHHARERMFGVIVRAPVLGLAAAAALVTAD
jgi:hypothetical protein